MLMELLRNLFFFALHVENSSVFPKPLSKKEEQECFEAMSQGDRRQEAASSSIIFASLPIS